jgi:spore coat protein U domain-containing protein, fimbrial subunit CupE1/2/3/6
MYGFRRSVVRIAACVAVVILAGVSRAEAANCSLSTTSILFGTYNVFSSAPVDSTGSVTYRCNGTTPGVLITITKGQSATFLPRELGKGLERLDYNLFRDAARTTVWGDFTGGTSAFIDIDPPKKEDLTVTVYGRIPPGQDISAGSYTDSVTVVMNF